MAEHWRKPKGSNYYPPGTEEPGPPNWNFVLMTMLILCFLFWFWIYGVVS